MILYDITNKENAIRTIENLTGISKDRFFINLKEVEKFRWNIDDVIKVFKDKFHVDLKFPIDEVICRIQHITTSANGCESIVKKGIKDLKSCYEDKESELRIFLEKNKILIDLEKEIIHYDGKQQSIHYSQNRPDRHTEEDKLWLIGRKFFYDFCICGFYSINFKHLYGGMVHQRPEILKDIEKLVNYNLENIWKKNHKPYIVTFEVPYNYIVNQLVSDDDIRECLLYNAFYNSIEENQENIVLLKNGIQIPPNNIVSVQELKHIEYGTYSL